MFIILPRGGSLMDNDPQVTTGGKGQDEQNRQNRRQFFNGLGKWSLAIIVAVTALRDGSHAVQSGSGSAFETPSGGTGDRRQLARKPKHTDMGHVRHSNHIDNVGIKKPGGTQSPGGGTVAPGGSLDKSQ
jgi:hypothetical protein